MGLKQFSQLIFFLSELLILEPNDLLKSKLSSSATL